MNKKHLIHAAIVAMAWAAGTPAGAQAIYRCGDSYGQQPCVGGTVVPATDTRSAQQGAQTSQAAARDGRLADAMEKARLKEEARTAPAYVYPERSSAEPAAAKEAPVVKPKVPAHFTAVAPAKPGEGPVAGKKKTKKKKKA